MATQWKTGMAGIFDSEDSILKAARKTREMGFQKFEVLTPYPVHGMEEACAIKRSWIPYVTFVAGIVGLGSGLLLTWWTSAVDWALNIGGKPFFSLPAFIPIMFELTILFAALSSVAALFYACGLPKIDPPIIHKDLTCSKFAVFIPCDDTGYDEGKIGDLFKALGASEVKKASTKMKAWQKIAALTIVSAVTAGGLTACGPSGGKPNVEVMQDMMVMDSDKPQKYDEFFPDHTASRVPPEHTVPVGFKPYKYGVNFEQANKENKNPMAGDFSKDVLMVGQKFYETNCMLCHGQAGKGDGPVGTKMALKPPPLISDKIKGWNDGGIYHVISVGQGVMGGYATHIPQQYRWQVVNYVRHLQKLDNEAKK